MCALALSLSLPPSLGGGGQLGMWLSGLHIAKLRMQEGLGGIPKDKKEKEGRREGEEGGGVREGRREEKKKEEGKGKSELHHLR